MTVTSVSPSDAARWIADGEAVLVDVRSPAEYRAAHIAGALSLPLDTLPGALATLGVPSGRKVIFQCQRGMRSEAACRAVMDSACVRFSLAGGIDAWRAAGLPVVAGG